jgi:hypothetical protein
MWQLQRNLTEDRGIMMNQMSRDVQNSLVHLHLVHTKNNIDSLAIQDDKTSREHSHDKLEWDFMGHPIGNHSADGSADIIWHFCSTESKLSLLSTGLAHEVIRCSKIELYNDWMLQQEEHTSKNFLTRRNLLDHSEVGTTNSRRRWANHCLLLTARL